MILVLTSLIAIEHIGFMLIEMFSSKEVQSKAFDMPLSFLQDSHAQTALANQGIYNGMLGVTILLSNWIIPSVSIYPFMALLMLFISVVGIYGSLTATKKIFFIQALPALVTLLIILFK